MDYPSGSNLIPRGFKIGELFPAVARRDMTREAGSERCKVVGFEGGGEGHDVSQGM